MAGVIGWAICIVMLVVTVACQRPKGRWLRSLKYRDVTALIPAWTFFAPNPGTTDTRVLWRDRLVDGAVSPWKELLPPTGGHLRTLWNPQKRQNKLLTDVGPMIVRMALDRPKSKMIFVSLPYLLLLNRVMNLPSSPLVSARQFVVVQTQHEGALDKDLRPLFASHWHALSSQQDLPLNAVTSSSETQGVV